MTDATQEPEPAPLSLVQRLRLNAEDLTSTYVVTDAHGDPLDERRPLDGSEEDFDDPLDPVEFEPEQLHDLANLYREAATALEEAQAEIAALKAAGDPPDRAPLLVQLESLISGDEMASACGQGVVELIRDAVAAIRTDARRLNNYRTHMEAWHRWGREMAGVGGDNIEPPEVLRQRLDTRFGSGKLALLVQPIRRRVELVWALCADLGLGTEEAADLAPKAALWTDAEVAEIEAFRTRDWSGSGLNPFDHLPAALERTVYPGPGGRRAAMKRMGVELPPAPAKPEEHQLGLPGLPKPETAMRLRLALIDKPDSPEAALVAGFALTMLERPDRLDVVRWTLRQILSTGTRLSDIFNPTTGTFGAVPVTEGWPVERERLTETMIAVSAAEYGQSFHQPPERDRLFDADLRHAMGHTARAQAESPRRAAPRDLPAPPGYTHWISMGNSGWAFEGKRVADDVLGAWAHRWGLSEQGASDLRKLVVAAARSEERNEFGQWLVTTFQPGAVDEAAVLFGGGEYESGEAFCRRVLQLALDRGAFTAEAAQRRDDALGWAAWARALIGKQDGSLDDVRTAISEVVSAPNRHWQQVAGLLWEILEAIEATDPNDTEMNKAQFRGTVRALANRRHDLMTKPVG